MERAISTVILLSIPRKNQDGLLIHNRPIVLSFGGTHTIRNAINRVNLRNTKMDQVPSTGRHWRLYDLKYKKFSLTSKYRIFPKNTL